MPIKKGGRLVRSGAICARLGIERSTLRRWIRSGKFPPPLPLDGTVSRWFEDDVDEWFLERRAARDASEKKKTAS